MKKPVKAREMKLKEPDIFKNGATMQDYMKWVNSLPEPVYNYWFYSAMLKQMNMGVINAALVYPEYFEEHKKYNTGID